LIALLATLVLPPTMNGQEAPIWAGTWHVASETSTYTGPPSYTRATYIIAPEGDGLHITYEGVLSRGGVTHLEWRGKLDGSEQPVQGSDEYLTYAYLAPSIARWELTARIDGRVVATAVVTFAADGKTMTTVTRAVADGKPIVTTTVCRKR
jgi:hypothetical protein